MSGGAPDRPGVAALLEALAVRRHARRGLATGVAVATLVFGLSAYLPGTEESLVYWAGLSIVLAAGVAGLVTAVLVARAVIPRTRTVHDIERGRRSPATLAVLLGFGGWLVVAVAASVVVDRPDADLRLAVAVVSGGFVVLAGGGLGVPVAVAVSVSHAWRPRATAAGAVAETVVLAAPAVGCPSAGPCLDTPNRLVAAVAGVDAGALAPAYAAVVVAGGLVVGATLGNRGVPPANAVAAGAVAAVASLPLAAAAAGDAGSVRMTAR